MGAGIAVATLFTCTRAVVKVKISGKSRLANEAMREEPLFLHFSGEGPEN
jgi:hypothetical protein